MEDDFEITPAMRAYLTAFDRCLRATEDDARDAHDAKDRALTNLKYESGRLRQRGWHAPLTEREAAALELRLHGLARTEIADRMGVAAKTVGRFFESIHTRLGTSDPYLVTIWAISRGFLTDLPLTFRRTSA